MHTRIQVASSQGAKLIRVSRADHSAQVVHRDWSAELVCRTHSHRHRHIHTITAATTTQDLLTNLPCIPDNLAFSQQPGGEAEAGALPQAEAGSGGGDALYVGCAAKRARPFALLDVMASLDKVCVRCTQNARTHARAHTHAHTTIHTCIRARTHTHTHTRTHTHAHTHIHTQGGSIRRMLGSLVYAVDKVQWLYRCTSRTQPETAVQCRSRCAHTSIPTTLFILLCLALKVTRSIVSYTHVPPSTSGKSVTSMLVQGRTH